MSRIAWTAIGSLVAVPALAFSTLNVVVGISHEEERLERRFDAAGLEAIDIVGTGRIRVVGADVDAVTVEMRVSHGLRRTGHTERVVDGVLVLDSTCPLLLSSFCEIDYDVEVPRDLDVRIDNGNGPVDLHGLGGDLVVDGDNGRIAADGLTSRTVRVSNDNGDIDLELDEAPDEVVVDNDNGSIDIVVPAVDEGYAVETRNANGSVDVLVRDDPSSPRTIGVENDNGDITVRSP